MSYYFVVTLNLMVQKEKNLYILEVLRGTTNVVCCKRQSCKKEHPLGTTKKQLFKKQTRQESDILYPPSFPSSLWIASLPNPQLLVTAGTSGCQTFSSLEHTILLFKKILD